MHSSSSRNRQLRPLRHRRAADEDFQGFAREAAGAGSVRMISAATDARNLFVALIATSPAVAALDVGALVIRGPQGWTPWSIGGLILIEAAFTAIIGGLAVFLIGLPVGRWLRRQGRFSFAPLWVGGLLLGVLVAVGFAAWGNTPLKIDNPSLWISISLDGLMGASCGAIWWLLAHSRYRALDGKH